MCAIAGIMDMLGQSLPAESAVQVEAMVAAMRHRGPDEAGCRHMGPAVLGHARLSIIDLSTGTQPIGNEDGSIQVVFNGEIFNYPELRAELEAKGHRFSTSTDTEVIVHAYEERGVDCLHDFNGQFALALWDGPRRRLFLARDRVGICPLHYAQIGGRLLFASEAKALLGREGLPRRLDLQALNQFLTFWLPLAPHTMFEGISELPPAHFALVEDGKLRVEPYWRLDFTPDSRAWTAEDAAQALGEALGEATRIRLRADVPVGVYLSGGLDSSYVAARVFGLSSARRATFSVEFADKDFDESPHQRVMADRLGSEHARVSVDDALLRKDFLRMIWNAEKPSLRSAPAPLFRLSRLARDSGYKVVLTGEGADEFLAGYNIFKEAKVRQFWARRPDSPMRPLLLTRLYPYLKLPRERGTAFLRQFFGRDLERTAEPCYSHLLRWANTSTLKRFFSAQVKAELNNGSGRHGPSDLADLVEQLALGLPADMHGWDTLSKAQYLEAALFLPGYLLSTQGDRMLMANAVEGRFPFLDHKVIELANRLPARLKMPGLREKDLLKRAASGLLPSEIVRRPKQPYRAPAAKSVLGTPMNGRARELLSPSALERAGYFDPAMVAGLLDKHARTGGMLAEMENMAIMAILSTQALHWSFIDNHGPMA
ncbi:asparagine synthase (glutamine-hydrolyzing) [Desulfocurvibacter africanus]|uniref:asparagine synthase (glutamine-hydrolyzing) n=1 Tax=Desulfocurvibacter africanus subsp. africanus str. Walvis Bay TaxID=690850 RepID=F3YZN1_DESAF|nr:asparagine synthase (glutamine-hydrolyzing) [Desulfocurvibacter africanus]EGJ49730.1 asparagine synthase (glutamine-hydrolyzing) [Desulfocurvibacter africanus subsp. africanus str. Walvis Bay]